MIITNAIRKHAPTLAIWLSRPQNLTAIRWLGSLGGCAGQPGRLRRAAVEIAADHPDASPDDVLLWAEARAFPAA